MLESMKVGTVEGTGAALNVSCGFQPRAVFLQNIDGNASLSWAQDMGAGHGFKSGGNVGNMALSAAGLVIGSAAAEKVKIANTVTFLNGGLFKSKTTAEIAFTATTHDIAANATTIQEAVYLVSLAADGTPALTMGTVATGAGLAVIPACPTGKTPIGYLRLAVAAGSTSFDASTDALSAGHLTDTYADLAFLPTMGSWGADVSSGGITKYAGSEAANSEGFTIGADVDLNVSAETIMWTAFR